MNTPRTDRLAIAIAVLVAAVSIISAVVAGRAAVWSSTASDIDSLVLQEAIERQQIEADLDIAAAADLRLAARYDTAFQRSRSLADAAATLRSTDPDAAARLELEAQAAWDVDLALWRFFRTAVPSYGEDGAIDFDPQAAVAAQRAADARLVELRASQTPGRAADAHQRTIELVGIAVLFVAALFALTVTEVWSRRGRSLPLVAGVALAFVAGVLTVSVDPDTAIIVGAVALGAAVLLGFALGVPVWRGRRRVAAAAGVPADGSATADVVSVSATSPDAAASPDAASPDAPATTAASPTTDSREDGEGSGRLRAAVAVTLAAATLLGAGVGYLQGSASEAGAAATREAQDTALLALTDHGRTTAWATAQVEVWSEVEELRARAVGARQIARYLAGVGDLGASAAASMDAARWDEAAAAADALTVLSDDHPDGPAADPGFPARFLVRQQELRAERVALQDLANEASASWGNRGAAFVAILATIAIAAYLLGLALVLRGRRQRGLFAIVGAGLVAAAGIAAAATAMEPDQARPPEERHAIARAFATARVVSEAARTATDRAGAVAAYQEVVRLHPDYARARVELASALFEASSPQTTGYSSVATIDAVRAALAELEAAAELGWDDLGTRGDTGFYRLLVGLAEPATGATAQAVEDTAAALELGPDLPVLRYNHAAALLGDGRVEEARTAYGAAIAATVATGPDGAPVFSEVERAGVTAGAITDLELILASRSDDPALAAAVAELRTAIVVGTGDPVPAEITGTPPTVSDLDLFHNASELWWQARIDGFDGERDALSVLWLAEDPEVPGWHVLPGHSGPLRLGRTTPAGELWENGAAPDYYGTQKYLLASVPNRCVPDGRYRVEIYLNGVLAAEPVVETIDTQELTTEIRPDLGLLFCRPSSWSVRPGERGATVSFADEAGDPVMVVARVFRPDPGGDAGRAEVVGVLDAIAAGWDGPYVALAEDATDTWFVGLAHAAVQWYEGPGGWLKVVGGVTSQGTVIAVAMLGEPEWVDGDEAFGILGSFLLQ